MEQDGDEVLVGHEAPVVGREAVVAFALGLDEGILHGVMSQHQLLKNFAADCICEIPHLSIRWVRSLNCPQTEQ